MKIGPARVAQVCVNETEIQQMENECEYIVTTLQQDNKTP